MSSISNPLAEVSRALVSERLRLRGSVGQGITDDVFIRLALQIAQQGKRSTRPLDRCRHTHHR